MLSIKLYNFQIMKSNLIHFPFFRIVFYSTAPKKVFGFAVKPDIGIIEADYIGPPDLKSNLRPIIRHVPKNATKLQNKLLQRRIEVENWNQIFWESHNKRFLEEKEEFIKINKTDGSESVSSDKMSLFFKSFLDKNWQLHFYYNISWYIKNIELLFLAILVNIQSLYKKK